MPTIGREDTDLARLVIGHEDTAAGILDQACHAPERRGPLLERSQGDSLDGDLRFRRVS